MKAKLVLGDVTAVSVGSEFDQHTGRSGRHEHELTACRRHIQ